VHNSLFNTEWSLIPSGVNYPIFSIKKFIGENSVKNMRFVTTTYSSWFVNVLQQKIFASTYP